MQVFLENEIKDLEGRHEFPQDESMSTIFSVGEFSVRSLLPVEKYCFTDIITADKEQYVVCANTVAGTEASQVGQQRQEE